MVPLQLNVGVIQQHCYCEIMVSELLDYYVLDTLADDIEALEQVLAGARRAAALWRSDVTPDAVTRQDVAMSLLRLLSDGSIAALGLASSGSELEELEGEATLAQFDEYWFRLTPRGRMLHAHWNPPPEREAV